VDQGTSAENKAVLSGFVGSFGTYTVNEAEKTIITRVEGSVFPNLVGVDQKRSIVSLTGDELKYINPATSTGMTAESTWKRVK
jgi:Lipocalin-like domain